MSRLFGGMFALGLELIRKQVEYGTKEYYLYEALSREGNTVSYNKVLMKKLKRAVALNISREHRIARRLFITLEAVEKIILSEERFILNWLPDIEEIV